MIYFKKVRWKNLLSTGNQPTEILLDKFNTTLIIGENGSGKSTVLDALCFGLFGKAYRPIKKAQLINSINQRDTLVEIEFEIGTNKFKVIRGTKPNRFEIIRNGEELDQEAHSRDFQKILEDQILKLNYKSFTQVVILGSSGFIPFMQLSTAHRREVVEDILDIKIFSVMNILLKGQYKTIQGEQSDLILEDSLYKSEKKLQEDHLSKIEADAENRIEALIQEKGGYEEDLNERHIKNIELNDEIREMSSVTESANKLSTLRIQVDSKLTYSEKRKKFFSENDECDVCEQPIKKSFRKLRVKELETEAENYQSAITEMESELNRLNKNILEMNKKSNDIQNNNAEMKAISAMIEKCNKDLETLKQDKERTDELKTSIEGLSKNIEEVDLRTKELKEDVFYLDICKNLLHDTGIKSKIIKQYLPVMNQTIQKYLGVLDFYVNFTLNDQFEETIKSRYRDEFSYASFSEGEKMRIDLALMFTWREIARLKNSTNTNLLIMDEVFDSSLDATGTEDFLKILNSLGGQNIFVISHKGDILFDKFNNIIKFQKQKNFSKIIET